MEEYSLGSGYKLLIGLYRRGTLQGGQLRDYISNYTTAVNEARKLEERDLIKITIVRDRRIVHYYELTDKGKKVAELLARADEIINS
jgi:DNA-binding MarR family transcriptional regulator